MTIPRLVARRFAVILFAVLAVVAAAAHAQQDLDDGLPRVHVLHLEGAVTRVMAAYVESGIDDAAEAGADIVIIALDTPGGRVDLTESVTRKMRSSTVPIVVWVGPEGAMAGSAGTFVTLAGHLSAMAPGTSIGAATPVAGNGDDLSETSKSKLVNMLVTRVRNLAERRGSQAQDWAERAVRDAAAATAEEARHLGVVDILAPDIDDLLRQLDSRRVTIGTRAVILHTTGARTIDVPMSEIERALDLVASPNIAFILLTLGMLGLIFEFVNPGFGLSGVVGAICLLLGVYALGMLPANYTGAALMLLAFALFFADVKLGSGGLVAMGGVVALVAGGVLLFDTPEAAVSPSVLATVAVCCSAFFVFAARLALATRNKTATTGNEGLVGTIGVARTDLTPDGIVVVWGENWRATAEEGTVRKGAAVQVASVDGLHVRVRAVPANVSQEEVS